MATTSDRLLKTAVVGLGDIATKAYLPTLGARRGVDLHLMTRNPERLREVGETYRVPADQRFTDLGTLLEQGLDAAFVHVATAAHAEVVGRLIEAGVPTYVDKPLADSAPESEALAEQALRAGVPLMVGFNRRFAPAYRWKPGTELIILQKDAVSEPGPVRDIVFDDFIHVIDTLRHLAPGPVESRTVTGSVKDGRLYHVTLTLAGRGFTAIGVMNRTSGAKRERLELAGTVGTREVFNLTEVVDRAVGRRLQDPAAGWEPVARQRGFEQICDRFLDAVRAGDDLRDELRDALVTHELCEYVTTELMTRSGAEVAGPGAASRHT